MLSTQVENLTQFISILMSDSINAYLIALKLNASLSRKS
jgi:hypothetical protein